MIDLNSQTGMTLHVDLQQNRSDAERALSKPKRDLEDFKAFDLSSGRTLLRADGTTIAGANT
ncbi:hypothetical protein OK016_08775 [Vibrio chagasii]|nr:hypothetical protein [Vibrio chagasii]